MVTTILNSDPDKCYCCAAPAYDYFSVEDGSGAEKRVYLCHPHYMNSKRAVWNYISNPGARRPEVYCDVDCVFAFFRKGACEVHGWTLERLAEARIEGSWDMREWMGLTNDEFWDPIHAAGADFWRHLEPLPWFEELHSYLKSLNVPWHLATSPSRCITSYIGKLQWIAHYFGPEKLADTFITRHKAKLGYKGDILIDDRTSTIEAWNAEGKHGVLFPHEANCLIEHKDNPIPYVRKHVDALLAH